MSGTAALGLPRMVDATKVATALAAKGGVPDLVNSFERARRIISCYADLQFAKQACEALAEIEPAEDHKGGASATLRQSLMFSAVSYYARATVTQSKSKGKGERGPSRPVFDERLEAMHENVINIRNKALAHVYLDDVDGEDDWHSAKVLMIEKPGGWWPASVTISSHYDPQVVRDLRELIPVAIAQIDDRVRERQDRAVKLLSQAVAERPFDLQFEDFAVDLVETFGSEEAAYTFYSGLMGQGPAAQL
ncbi:hypothetical protein [Sphingomonas sp.]|uniref:hypothetical protein n=1 Tax=Sphingomonas sp. TaxID=28214 RepID=UPI0025DCE5A6|nr:hypothetical protein [Sphingomonas sp.]